MGDAVLGQQRVFAWCMGDAVLGQQRVFAWCMRDAVLGQQKVFATRLKHQVKHEKHGGHLPLGQQPLQVDGGEVVVSAELVKTDDAAKREGGDTRCEA